MLSYKNIRLIILDENGLFFTKLPVVLKKNHSFLKRKFSEIQKKDVIS